MKIKKINQDLEINITVKKVRLPSLTERIESSDECKYIDVHSFSYGGDRLYHAFFKEFIRDEEMFAESFEDKYHPIYGNEYDCNGVVDLIPIIETEDNLDVGILYLANNIPFIAATENKLICLTRINYYMVSDIAFGEGLSFEKACDFLDRELERVSKW